jgi:hypothetical protein
MQRRAFFVVIILLAAAPFAPTTCGTDRYVAWLADGTRITSKSLSAWPLPGALLRLESPELTSSTSPVRLVRDRQLAAALKPPFVALASGDVVGGTVVQLEPELGRVAQVPRVRLQLEPPLMPVTGTGAVVRTDRVQRIAVSPESAMSQPPPGTVLLADGRRLFARAIRWREYGLAILTAEGVVDAAFGDLADVVFPNVDLRAAVIDDNLWAGGGSGTAIARFQTTTGAVVTAARVSREQEQARRRGRVTNAILYYVQPAWADQPLAIPEEEIVCCGYRAADEAPLPMFPSELLSQRRILGQPAPWTLNHAADSGLLTAANRESDIGIAAHAHSEIAFDLPAAARTLELAVGLDRRVGDGGCVRCKIVSDDAQQGKTLWDGGVIQGKDGAKLTGPIDVTGVKRVVLVTEFAHDGRPTGADPLDVRDEVVWLSPLVKLDLSEGGSANRALAVLPGAADWELAGDGWRSAQLGSRWNVPASSWDPVLTLEKGAELTLRRKLRVTRASDVLELLTICPHDLEEHDFSLKINGQPTPWHNNADRNQLRQWTLRYSRTRAREGSDEESNLTDRLAYWWDLSPWRDQEVSLELTLRGKRDRSEIAWRGLAVRSAIGNLPETGQPLAPNAPLAQLEAMPGRSGPKAASTGNESKEPPRLLGQAFRGAYVLPRGNSVAFAVKPEYRKFVAVVGCTMQVAGPVQVLIDERVVWERSAINSLTPAEQIEIAIPDGSTTLTLQSGGDGLFYGTAAFAEAGFLVGQASRLP